MPNSPPSPCKYKGCRLLVDGFGYCSNHKSTADINRGSSCARGYGSRWQKARNVFLLANPLCVNCSESEKIASATVVDHKVPHRGDNKKFWDQSNWQALCKRCHDTKTATQDRYFIKG